MTLELNGRKVVVIGGAHDLGRTIGEAVSNQGTNMVIWIRDWKGDMNELKQLLPGMELQQAIVSQQQVNGTSRHISLWRQSMGAHKSYW
jgi:NAD(P)-dependent dehydrogenase (short-subunit alcohol dehydrogenase family)